MSIMDDEVIVTLCERLILPHRRGRLHKHQPRRHSMKRLPLIASVLTLAVLVSACGGEESPGTVIATATAVQGGNASPIDQSSDSRSTQNQDGATESTTAELTLGELVDRINARWVNVEAFREVSTSIVSAAPAPSVATAAASPASDQSQRAIREVILPDRVRYTFEQRGRRDYELLVIGDRVYARGTVAAMLDPLAGSDEWVETDLETIAANPMFGETGADQLSDLGPPRYAVPDRLRPQAVRSLGAVNVEGVECATYGAADTTESGARISLTFAVDADDRLCFIQTDAVGNSSRFTIDFLEAAFEIAAPENARLLATPVAGSTPVMVATPVATP